MSYHHSKVHSINGYTCILILYIHTVNVENDDVVTRKLLVDYYVYLYVFFLPLSHLCVVKILTVSYAKEATVGINNFISYSYACI